MTGKETKFWLENPQSLLTDYRLIPVQGMEMEGRLNTITRLVVMTSVILYVLGFKESILFLLLTLTLIIILYYLEKGKMATTTENFSYKQKGNGQSALDNLERRVLEKQRISNAISQKSGLYCNDSFEVNFDDRFVSENHQLAGKPNPKTLVQPIMPHRAYDWTVWRNNDYNNFSSQINNRTRQHLYDNGYLEQTPDCGGNNDCLSLKYAGPSEYMPLPPRKTAIQEGFESAMNKRQPPVNTKPQYQENYDENPYQYSSFDEGNNTNIRAGDLNTACGYRPENSKYNMPVNYPSSTMQRTKELSDYNKNIFTQHAGEDIYQYNQINEPDNWNIGISFNQQFPPTTLEVDKKGFHFQEHDPRTFKVPNGTIIDPFEMEPRPDDVYDPRQTGYGANYRTYVDPLTGQPRFYYDDVTAVRRSNYITRNKIDHIPNLNQTGVMKPNQDIFTTAAEIRKLANDNFTDSMITQRVELQQRLMRKRNSDWWQRKVAPIYSSGGSGGGAGIKC